MLDVTLQRADEPTVFWTGIAASIAAGDVPLSAAIRLAEEGPALWDAMVITPGQPRSYVAFADVTSAIPERLLVAGMQFAKVLAAPPDGIARRSALSNSILYRQAFTRLHKAWTDGTPESLEEARVFLDTQFRPVRPDRFPEGMEQWAVQVLLYLLALLTGSSVRWRSSLIYAVECAGLSYEAIARICKGLGPPTVAEVVTAANAMTR